MFARLKQIGWGSLFGVLIAFQALGPAFAQTATLLPNAKQQFFSDTGVPLAAGTVDFFIPSTNTRKTTWKSSTESVGNQNTNPVALDAAGRALIYGDGSYRQVVKDADGNTIWDAVTASTGGSGGGGAVPSSEGVMVGTIIPWANLTLPAQYLYAAGQAISRATYPDLFNAITFSTIILCQSGIATITVSTDISDKTPIGAPIEASCFAPGSTVIAKSSGQLTMSTNATTTVSISAIIFPWGNGDGSTTFNVPDLRGTVIAGRNNMNGSTGSRLTSTYFSSVNPNAVNAFGGSQSHTLTATEAAALTYATVFSVLPNQYGPTTILTNVASTSGISVWASPSSTTTQQSIATGGTLATTSNAGGNPHSIVQPTLTADYIIKALPDDSPTGPGVSSIGGMTGVIACGSGLVCTANTVSVSAAATAITDGTTPILGGSNDTLLVNTGGVFSHITGVANAVLSTNGSSIPALSTTLPSSLTIPSPTVTGESSTAIVSLGLRDTSAAFDLTLAATSSPALTAGRALTLNVANGARSINLSGNLTLANNFTTSGNFTVTQTYTAGTNVTFPTTGTLATLAGTEVLTNKTINCANQTSCVVRLASDVSGQTPIANGGTAQTTAIAARQSSGLNIYGDVGTPHGDAGVTIGNTERFAYTNASFTASRAWVLPAANVTGAPYTLKIADLFGGITGVNTLVITRAGADTINGGTTATISAAFGGYECTSDGSSKWNCLSLGAASGGGVTSITAGTGLSGGTITTSGTIAVNLSTITNSLGGNVNMNNTGLYFDGPSIAQGTSGTWFASGTVSLADSGAQNTFYCKLWDATTVIASGVATSGVGSANPTMALSGYLASPAANIRISCRDITATGAIVANTTGNLKDSTISAFRIQ